MNRAVLFLLLVFCACTKKNKKLDEYLMQLNQLHLNVMTGECYKPCLDSADVIINEAFGLGLENPDLHIHAAKFARLANDFKLMEYHAFTAYKQDSSLYYSNYYLMSLILSKQKEKASKLFDEKVEGQLLDSLEVSSAYYFTLSQLYYAFEKDSMAEEIWNWGVKYFEDELVGLDSAAISEFTTFPFDSSDRLFVKDHRFQFEPKPLSQQSVPIREDLDSLLEQKSP